MISKALSERVGFIEYLLDVGFPGGTSQHRRHKRRGFSPWVGKVWRRAQQPTPVFSPGKSHGQGRLVGYNPQGCKESDAD